MMHLDNNNFILSAPIQSRRVQSNPIRADPIRLNTNHFHVVVSLLLLSLQQQQQQQFLWMPSSNTQNKMPAPATLQGRFCVW